MVEPPECEVSPQAITIAAESLYAIDEKYGPDSDHSLSFHNGPHSLGVTRRAVRLTNILYPYMRPQHRVGIYDLDFIGGSMHDIEQDLEPGENERVSGEQAIACAIEADVPGIDTPAFSKRLFDGIQATAVQMRENGEVVQVNVQNGTHDPFKFVMSFGDINGIAMEGSKRMFNDATNLCYEIHGGEPTLDQLYEFLSNQAVFLRQRLNDGRVKSDIAYYFPNDIEDVYQDMRAAFHTNILAAHGIAKSLGDRRPELQGAVSAAIKGIGVLDRALLGDVISKTIHSKLTPSD